jgi:hypothetical protein
MRLKPFQDLLVPAVQATLGEFETIKTFAECESAASMWGAVGTWNGQVDEMWFQITGTTAPADKGQPDYVPATGPRPEPVPMPEHPFGIRDFECALSSQLLQADTRGEFASIQRYSEMINRPAIGRGLRIRCHDESTLFVNILQSKDYRDLVRVRPSAT